MILALIFTSPTDFAKLQTNARNWTQIGARWREWQSHSVDYQRHDLKESTMCHQIPAVWMCSDWKLQMTYSQLENKIQESSEFGEEL